MSREGVRLRAFAKINLHLEVAGRRADGYHELRTLFQTVSLHDTLRAAPAPGESSSLQCSGRAAGVPAGPDNLVLRAAEAIARRARLPAAAFHLVKRIPAASGLGGGSSDAAAALLALLAWSRAPGDPDELRLVARELGADVPFFLDGGLARGTERGDRIEPLPDLPRLGVVIAFGRVPLSTARVFAAWTARLTPPVPASTIAEIEDGLRSRSPVVLRNDLEPAAKALSAEVQPLLDRVAATLPLAYRMSGSGPSVFGLFGRCEDARDAARALRRDGVDALAGFTVGRAEYRRWRGPLRAGR